MPPQKYNCIYTTVGIKKYNIIVKVKYRHKDGVPPIDKEVKWCHHFKSYLFFNPLLIYFLMWPDNAAMAIEVSAES